MARSYLNIGNVYKDQRDYGNALCIYQTALHVLLAVHDQDHPHVATLKFNLALLQKERGEIVVARTLFRESKQTFTRVLGPDHMWTLMTERGASECVQGYCEITSTHKQDIDGVRLGGDAGSLEANKFSSNSRPQNACY